MSKDILITTTLLFYWLVKHKGLLVFFQTTGVLEEAGADAVVTTGMGAEMIGVACETTRVATEDTRVVLAEPEYLSSL